MGEGGGVIYFDFGHLHDAGTNFPAKLHGFPKEKQKGPSCS